MNLSILYRGPLSSCNYGCVYCPFAKLAETYAELEEDRRCLNRFVEWVSGAKDLKPGILFTPWGEALFRSWYQDALVYLSNQQNVRRVAIQTNLSCRLDWLDRCDLTRVALWATYHPSETTRRNFLDRCNDLLARGVRFSAGVVGLRDHLKEIESLREELPSHIYVWVNAYKDQANYYREDEIVRFEKVDPYFRTNLLAHPSFGLPCRAGHEAISVDGEGTIRRCHFVREPIGNVYDPNWRSVLRERTCPNTTCGCHIGYVHLPVLRQYELYGAGLLERIPDSWAADHAAGRNQDSASNL